MNAGGETADQLVKMSLQGIEVAAEIALKAGGGVSKSLAATLYAILTDKKKVKGKARLDSMLKSGKELKIFAIRHSDLKVFCEEAKRYGVLYSVLKEKNNTDGICDIMVRAEDAAKISRIVDKYELATIDTKAIREAIMNERANELKNVPLMKDKEHDQLVKTLMESTISRPKEVIEMEINPEEARTTKASESRFGPISRNAKSTEDIERPSVREKLNRFKQEEKMGQFPKQKSKARTKNKRIKEK